MFHSAMESPGAAFYVPPRWSHLVQLRLQARGAHGDVFDVVVHEQLAGLGSESRRQIGEYRRDGNRFNPEILDRSIKIILLMRLYGKK